MTPFKSPPFEHNQSEPFHYLPQEQPTCLARALAWNTLPSRSWLGGGLGPPSELSIERPASARVEDGGFRFAHEILVNGPLVASAKHVEQGLLAFESDNLTCRPHSAGIVPPSQRAMHCVQ